MIVENEQIISQVTIVSGFSRSVQHEIKIVVEVRAASLVGGCYWTASVDKDMPACLPRGAPVQPEQKVIEKA